MSQPTPTKSPAEKNSPSRLLPPRFMFRFSVPCNFYKATWQNNKIHLGEEYLLPDLTALDDRYGFAKVYLGWNQGGLFVTLRINRPKAKPLCHENRMDHSDGLQVFIDTRDTKTIHRASRFCHRFAFLPAGGGRNKDRPLADQLLIARARENAPPVRPGLLGVFSEVTDKGWAVSGYIPAEAMTGFDPNEQSRIGFAYRVLDHQIGEQTLTVGSELPFDEDPSLWATIELTK